MARYTLSLEIEVDEELEKEQKNKLKFLLAIKQIESEVEEDKIKACGLCTKHRIYKNMYGFCDMCE